ARVQVQRGGDVGLRTLPAGVPRLATGGAAASPKRREGAKGNPARTLPRARLLDGGRLRSPAAAARGLEDEAVAGLDLAAGDRRQLEHLSRGAHQALSAWLGGSAASRGV